MKQSFVLHRSELNQETAYVYARRIRRGANRNLFRLRSIENHAALDNAIQKMIAHADDVGKPIEINVQWCPPSKQFPATFQP